MSDSEAIDVRTAVNQRQEDIVHQSPDDDRSMALNDGDEDDVLHDSSSQNKR